MKRRDVDNQNAFINGNDGNKNNINTCFKVRGFYHFQLFQLEFAKQWVTMFLLRLL